MASKDDRSTGEARPQSLEPAERFSAIFTSLTHARLAVDRLAVHLSEIKPPPSPEESEQWEALERHLDRAHVLARNGCAE